MSDDNKFTEMRIKFLNYFEWALVQGEDKYTNMMDTCENECKIEDRDDMCCTSVTMKGDRGKSYKQLQCMNSAVSDLSSGLWIEDFYYEYECRKGDWDSYRSGAINLAVGATTLLLAFTSI